MISVLKYSQKVIQKHEWLENGQRLLTCPALNTYFQGLDMTKKGPDIDTKYQEIKCFQYGC